jgi:phage terminase small subunit
VAETPAKLKPQYELFVSAYLGKCRRNATSAAIEAGYSPKTAYSQGSRLLKTVEVQQAIQAWREEAKQTAITDMAHRLNVLDSIEAKLLDVMDARATQYAGSQVIGGETGLVVKRYKMVGAGESAMLVEEYEVDTGTIRELRAVHEQAAKEMGQWTEKHDVSGSIVREFVLVPDAGEPESAA